MSLNIVFLGTPSFGLPCLNALHESKHVIKAVFTQPDRRAGRGQILQASPIKNWALAGGIPVYQPISFKEAEALESLEALNPDLLIVIAYGLILPKRVLEVPKYGAINVHASLLPRFRGASPIQQAILAGDPVTGITIMQMDQGLDTGGILKQVTVSIGSGETAGSLQEKLAHLGISPLLETLDAIEGTGLYPVPQEDSKATYAPKIQKKDAKIDWNLSALQIERQIRAFNPMPVSYTLINTLPIRIFKAKANTLDLAAPPGTLFKLSTCGLLVACAKGSLLIETLQLPGKKVLSVSQCFSALSQHLKEGMQFS